VESLNPASLPKPAVLSFSTPPVALTLTVWVSGTDGISSPVRVLPVSTPILSLVSILSSILSISETMRSPFRVPFPLAIPRIPRSAAAVELFRGEIVRVPAPVLTSVMLMPSLSSLIVAVISPPPTASILTRTSCTIMDPPRSRSTVVPSTLVICMSVVPVSETDTPISARNVKPLISLILLTVSNALI